MMVWSSFFEYPGQGGPVTVSVFSNMDEKPDWTGLPSTNCRHCCYHRHCLHLLQTHSHLILLHVLHQKFLVFRLLPHQTRFSNNRHGYVGKQTADELSSSFEAVMHIPGRRLAPG